MEHRDRATPGLYLELDDLPEGKARRRREQEEIAIRRPRKGEPTHRRKREDDDERESDESDNLEFDTSSADRASPPPAKRVRLAEQGYNYRQRVKTAVLPDDFTGVKKPVGRAGEDRGEYSESFVKQTYDDMLKYAIPLPEGGVIHEDEELTKDFKPEYATRPPFQSRAGMKGVRRAINAAKVDDTGEYSTKWFELDQVRRDALRSVPLYDSMTMLAAKFSAPHEDFFIQEHDLSGFTHTINQELKDLESQIRARYRLKHETDKTQQKLYEDTQTQLRLFEQIAAKAFPTLAADDADATWTGVLENLRTLQTLSADNVADFVTAAKGGANWADYKTLNSQFLMFANLLNSAQTRNLSGSVDLTDSLRNAQTAARKIVDAMATILQYSPSVSLYTYLTSAQKPAKPKKEVSPGLLQVDADNMDLLRNSANWEASLSPFAGIVKFTNSSNGMMMVSRAETTDLLKDLFSLESRNGFGTVGSDDGIGLSNEAATALYEVLLWSKGSESSQLRRLYSQMSSAITSKTKLQEAAKACADLMEYLLVVPGPAPAGAAAPAPAPREVPDKKALADIDAGKIDLTRVLSENAIKFLRTGVSIERAFRKVWELQIPWAMDLRLLAAREFFSHEYVRRTLLALSQWNVYEHKIRNNVKAKRMESNTEALESTELIEKLMEKQNLRRDFMRMFWHSKQLLHLQPTFEISGRARVIIDAATEAIQQLGDGWEYFDSGPVLTKFWKDVTKPNSLPQPCSFREVFLSFMHYLDREKEPMNGVTSRSAAEEKRFAIRHMNEIRKILRYVPRMGDQAEEFPPYNPQLDRNMNFHPDHMHTRV